MGTVGARLTSQLLTGRPARSPEEVVGRLLAVQAQDSRGARLAVRARSTGLVATDVDRALEERALVVSWLNRGTLHLVAAEDYWWLHELTTPQLATGHTRRLRQEGVSQCQAERGVDVVVGAVARGPQTRAQLRDALDAAGVPTQRQALLHVLVAATLRGHVVRGPVIDGEHAFVSVERWLGPPPPRLDREVALGRLANRYLAGHAPATPEDLSRWAGITLADARRGFAASSAPKRRSHSLPKPRLLGPFDPLLLGWASREALVGAHAGVVTTNGIFRPVALVRGHVAGTWSLRGGTVTVAPFEDLARKELDALVIDAADVVRYLGLPPRLAVIGERRP